MNKIYKNIFTAALFLTPMITKAQNPVTNVIPINNEYVPVLSGLWDMGSNWNRWRSASAAYVSPSQSPDKGYPRTHVLDNFNMYFGSTLQGSNGAPQSIGRLFVHPQGTLISNADSMHTIRIYGDTTWVDGIFGGNGSDGWIYLEIWGGTDQGAGHKNFITGNGTISVSGLRFGANNVVATGPGFTDTLLVDNNISIKSGLFTTYYNSSNNNAADNHFIIINPGKTVTLTDTAAWHQRASTTTNPEGKALYQINGTLDMSAATGHSNIVPSSITATSAVTVNVNGLVKLGTQFNAINAAPSSTNGAVALNINTGGSVQAIKTNVPNAQFMYSTWISNGGYLRRIVGAADTVFPVRTATSVINSVTINNAGTKDTFNVAVRDGSSITWNGAVVNKQWSISNSTGSIGQITAKVMWTTADQGTGFSTTNGISAYVYNGTAWIEKAATVTGTGTNTDPYIASITPTLDTFNAIVIGAKGLVSGPSGVGTIAGNEHNVIIAPNPVTNHEVTIQSGDLVNGNYNVTVYNAIGAKVFNQALIIAGVKSTYHIALPAGLAAGIYQFSINNASTQFVQKIIIQ